MRKEITKEDIIKKYKRELENRSYIEDDETYVKLDYALELIDKAIQDRDKEVLEVIDKRTEQLIQNRKDIPKTCPNKRREVAIRQTQGRILELDYIKKQLEEKNE